MSLSLQQFGLHIDDCALAVQLDHYSTPDSWYGIGYDFEFIFAIDFTQIQNQQDRSELLDALSEALEHNFKLGKEHYKCRYPVGAPTLDYLNKHFGVNYESSKIQQSYPEYSVFQINVLWDRGGFDIRKLSMLATEMNTITVLRHACIHLVTLCIIPRSRETIQSKIKEI